MEAAAPHSPSFKEDTYFVCHLKSKEKKALQEFEGKLPKTMSTDYPSRRDRSVDGRSKIDRRRRGALHLEQMKSTSTRRETSDEPAEKILE